MTDEVRPVGAQSHPFADAMKERHRMVQKDGLGEDRPAAGIIQQMQATVRAQGSNGIAARLPHVIKV